ncbi:DUF454 domain-containing protein [Methanocella sp. CWC-04]|uniref:DUF454 domain-containing protein n=2 Tax=Methanooceanicella nereidis TaxID=2052831 RepID=A0AAP2W6F2_9EURY|nr:DUF454 domain-containing protein [Methanocella sp. CWC-04]
MRGLLNNIARGALIVAGTFFLFVGIIGVILPVLPTTPFLLLAAACYAVSSKRFYDWLINNKVFGNYIKNYREGKGIALNAKILTIGMLWSTMAISLFIVMENLLLVMFLILIATGVSAHIMLIPTLKK